MKNEGLIFGGLALAAVAALVGKKVYSASQLQLSIQKVGFKVSGLTAILTLDVRIANPTSSPFTAQALTGNVFVNGSRIGSVAVYPNKEIAAMQNTVIPVPCNVSLIGAGLELYQIISGQKAAAATVNFSGTATVNGIPAPLDLTYKIV